MASYEGSIDLEDINTSWEREAYLNDVDKVLRSA